MNTLVSSRLQIHRSMESVRETLTSIRKNADSFFDKTSVVFVRAYSTSYEYYEAAKKRSKSFVDTGVAHYQQTEELALDQIKGSFAWLGENQTYAYIALGTSAVILLPGLRRRFFRGLFRPFRSDEAIYRSAEDRLDAVSTNFQSNLKQSDTIRQSMDVAFEDYQAACQKIKSTSSSLSSLATQVNRDIKTTRDLLRDMREMPSRPSLKMQSDAAMQLKELESQRRQLENLQYKILQKGF